MLRYKPLSLSSLLFLTAQVQADEPQGWELTGAAGLSYSDGNSDSAAYSVQVLASYLDEMNEAYIGADWYYAENDGVQSTDSFKLYSQYNRDFSEKWYSGGNASFYKDDVAAIDYRVDTGILLGYHLIESERTTLDFEAGPGYAWEDSGGITSDFVTLRFAQRFEYEFTDTTRLWQSLVYTPRVDQFSDYVLDFEIGFETRLTDQWALRTSLRHRLDGSPALGRGDDDTTLMVGLAYDFSGLSEPESDTSDRRSLMPDDEDEEEDKKGWSATAALGFTLNKGNSDSMALQLAWNQAYLSDENEFFFDLAQTFSEDNGATSTDRTSSRLQYNRIMSERFYLGGSLTYTRDAPAEIDYRLTPAFLAGYKLIKEEDTTLAFEGGPSYTFEKVGRITDDFTSVTAAERFDHDFNSRVSFKQSIVYISEISDFDNFHLVVSAALDTKLSGQLIWRLGADYTYENQPAALRDHHDTSIVSSLAMKF
ncbi:YdiY family protein [Haloferula chungangensis]|uniref:YdiY family protein n=1 Tax=Haloferula chungangensis TaxID=1048331 RepID=A0ABW2L9N3_9BACT